jgi:peptidoglycan-associated lipoprotein
MKAISIVALVLFSATAACKAENETNETNETVAPIVATVESTTEDIKTYINDQITDAVTQLSTTDVGLQTQIKTLEQQVADLSVLVEAATLNTVAVYFGLDNSTLSAEEIANLKPIIEFLNKNASATVIVEGYADDRGTREYNLGLGKTRAESVKQILVNNGVVAGRIGVLSYGKERPVCIDSEEGCWKINRRVQFNIRF